MKWRIPKSLRPFILGVGIVCVILAVALTVIVLPNQVRHIPEPTVSLEIIPTHTLSDIDALEIRQSDAQTSIATNSETPKAQAADSATSATFLRRFHPIQDIAALPNDFQTSATAWNDGIDNLVLALNDLAQRSANITRDEFYHAVFEFNRDYEKLHDQYAIIHNSQDYHYQLRWSTARSRATLAWGIHHQDWNTASYSCRELAFSEGSGSLEMGHWGVKYWKLDPEWREREFYYLRQWGLTGRTILAYESIVPILGEYRYPLEGYVLRPMTKPAISALERVDKLFTP